MLISFKSWIKSRLETAIKRLKIVWTDTASDSIELSVGLVTLFYGIGLQFFAGEEPNNTVLYFHMTNIMSQRCWTVLSFGTGIFTLFSFLFSSLKMRRLSMYFMFLFWVILTVVFYLSTQAYGFIAVLLGGAVAIRVGAAYLRLGVDLKKCYIRRVTDSCKKEKNIVNNTR